MSRARGTLYGVVAVGYYRFYWWDERPEESEQLKWRRAPLVLDRFRRFGPTAAALRRLLAQRAPGDAWRLDAGGVLRVVGHRIATREILVYEYLPERGGTERGGESVAEAVPLFPLQERAVRPSGTAVMPETPSFPDDAALEAIADTLHRAAASGTPFCEECLKAAMGVS